MGHRADSVWLIEGMISDLVVMNVNSESKVAIAVSKRSMSSLRGRACENLSDRVQTEQNTKVC
jgi:hypothetical protein